MKHEMFFATIHILCFVCLATSIDVENVTQIPNGEKELDAGFVQNGRLESTWSDNFTQSTEDVDLSNLGISTLLEATFAKFTALHKLDLSSNRLVSTVNVVAALKNTRPLILNFSHNNLGSPDHDWPDQYGDRSFRQNKTLLFNSEYFWSIDVSNNSLVGIGIDFDVVYLNLSNNLMRCHNAIEPRQFSSKPIYVGNLDISHNLINCQARFFSPNIDILDMSYNNLTGINFGLLGGLHNLSKLDLGHNSIRYIHPHAFMDNSRLKSLNLRSNQIRHIYKQVWIPTLYLLVIDLSFNRLEYLDWDMIRIQISNVDVTGNENLHWSVGSNVYFQFCKVPSGTSKYKRCHRTFSGVASL